MSGPKSSLTNRGSNPSVERPKTCQYCTRISDNNSITVHDSTNSFYSVIYGNCQSSNLIYCLECNICIIKYSDQTKDRTLDRFQGHFFDIRNNKTLLWQGILSAMGRYIIPLSQCTFWNTSNVQRYTKVKFSKRQEGVDLDTHLKH